MTDKQNVHGEGNDQASRNYNDATRRFVESGRVEQAARDAAPRTPEEAAQLQHAERAALLRAKEKAPAVDAPARPEAGVDDPERGPRVPDGIDPAGGA